MTGTVRTIRENFGYGFIKCKGIDYFFHKDDFYGNWNDLVQDHSQDMRIEVEFDSVESPKGPRAANVKRLE